MIRNSSVVIFAALVAVGLSTALYDKADKFTKTTKKTFFVNNNPYSSDYKLFGEDEEHRYGVELKENMQFHHTTTAEDGVRLGCYGHMQDGKTFSTHYVADNKGYRLVPHDKVILVYPKSNGEPRKASFISAFDEEEVNRFNIRYFFPKGCKAPEIREILPIQKKPEAIDLPVTTYRPVSFATTTAKNVENITESSAFEAIRSLPALVRQDDLDTDESLICTTDCCQDSRAQIILPSASETCCRNYSTLLIPIRAEQLANIPIADIQSLNNSEEDDLILMLINLIKLVEKCRH